MSKSKQSPSPDSANSFQFTLTGLIAFCLCLIVGGGVVAGIFISRGQKPYSFAKNVIPAPDQQDDYTYTRQGPWGELLIQNIMLERPVEYIASEIEGIQPPTWTFRGMDVAQVRALFVANGLTPEQTGKALAPDRIGIQGTNTLFKPSEEFLFSLSPEMRQKLYDGLLGLGVTLYVEYPIVLPRDGVQTVYANTRLHPDDVALLKKLVYQSGKATHLGDYETLIREIPTTERRVAMTQVLSRQSAVLARLCIRPNTDIEKIAGYWGHMRNVRFTDLRPMVQAIKELPKGGTVSLVYLLPPFARDRLYTFPLPPGSSHMDCHWSTFNFDNLSPDNRFADPGFAAQNIRDNYYAIDRPTIYGDLVVMWNNKSQIVHSSVFLADDLVFTKNGSHYHQPWMIMRISDMEAMFPNMHVGFLRKKTN